MNERIKELLRQAQALARAEVKSNPEYAKYAPSYAIPGVHEIHVGLGLSYEKFAELIIKEYEKLLPEVCPWAESDQEGPMKGWHVQFVARKHFGVKE
jgi:hypothetical protein